jgi:hypothetical protein
MTESFEVSEVFPVGRKELYLAWLDSEKHGEFTGARRTSILLSGEGSPPGMVISKERRRNEAYFAKS